MRLSIPSSLERLKILFIIMAHIPEQVDNPEYKDVEFYSQLENIMRNFYKIICKKYNTNYIFVKCDENLDTETRLEGDILYVKEKENMDTGLCKKVSVSLKLFQYDYDFIFKTTICCIPNIAFLKAVALHYTDYAGPKITNSDTKKDFVGGFGILLSKKAVRILIENWNNFDTKHDDEKIGNILSGVEPKLYKVFLDSVSVHNLNQANQHVLESTIVIKNGVYKEGKNREDFFKVHDIYISEVYKKNRKNNTYFRRYICSYISASSGSNTPCRISRIL